MKMRLNTWKINNKTGKNGKWKMENGIGGVTARITTTKQLVKTSKTN